MPDDLKTIRITKMDTTARPPVDVKVAGKKKTVARKARLLKDKKPKFGILKGGKTARTKPRFEAVADPAKAPPHKKTARTLRVLTDKGLAERRTKIAGEARKTPIDAIRRTLRKAGIPADKAPEGLARKIYEDAQEAGMISPA
jgi:hypothetical protein